MEILLYWMNGLAAVAVILGLCIYFHELGHFVVAKLSGMKVEEFAFGLGPVMYGLQRGETLYAIRWIPFGGMVRIAGMEPGERDVERGFFTRPVLLGIATIVAGVFMNVVLAMLLFFAVTLWQGMPVPDSHATFVDMTLRGQPARAAGLQPGDQLLSVNHETNGLLVKAVSPGSPAARAGLKEGDLIAQLGQTAINTPTDLIAALRQTGVREAGLGVIRAEAANPLEAGAICPLQVPPPLLVDRTPPTPPQALELAQKQLGLSFQPLDGSALAGYISARPNIPVTLQIKRDGQQLALSVTPSQVNDRTMRLDPKGRIIGPILPLGRIGIVLRPELRPATVGEAVHSAWYGSVGAVMMVVDFVRGLVRQTVAPEVSGPVGIIAGTMQQAKYGWERVLEWGGMISINLAVVNILIIPPLDGFWVLLLVFRWIVSVAVRVFRANPDPAGDKALEVVLERLEVVVRFAGLALILLLFVGLIGKDVWNLTRYGVP